jgi:predicted nucleotidyltransferase
MSVAAAWREQAAQERRLDWYRPTKPSEIPVIGHRRRIAQSSDHQQRTTGRHSRSLCTVPRHAGDQNKVAKQPEASGQEATAQHGQAVLAEIVRRLVTELHPERIYLFGSRARGDAQPDSDYDLLVVVPASDLDRYHRDLLAFNALCGVGVSKDVLVYTREEFEFRSKAASSLPATVLREGKLLYAA